MQGEMKPMKSFDVYEEIPIEIVLKKTPIMHWMVLGSNEGRLPLRLDMDCVLEVAFKKQWIKMMFLLAPQH